MSFKSRKGVFLAKSRSDDGRRKRFVKLQVTEQDNSHENLFFGIARLDKPREVASMFTLAERKGFDVLRIANNGKGAEERDEKAKEEALVERIGQRQRDIL